MFHRCRSAVATPPLLATFAMLAKSGGFATALLKFRRLRASGARVSRLSAHSCALVRGVQTVILRADDAAAASPRMKTNAANGAGRAQVRFPGPGTVVEVVLCLS